VTTWVNPEPPEFEQAPEESWPHMILGLVVLAGTIWLLVVVAGVAG
jgi:hypothetical protein